MARIGKLQRECLAEAVTNPHGIVVVRPAEYWRDGNQKQLERLAERGFLTRSKTSLVIYYITDEGRRAYSM